MYLKNIKNIHFLLAAIKAGSVTRVTMVRSMQIVLSFMIQVIISKNIISPKLQL
jgi:hypothetical protein